MRKGSFLVAIAIILAIVIIACQKEAGRSPITAPFNADAAKEWYYARFKKSPEWASYQSSVYGKKIPDWKQGIYTKTKDMEMVEFPIVCEKKKVTIIGNPSLTEVDRIRIAEATQERIVFIRHSNGKVTVRELQYIPDLDYLSSHAFDISANHIGHFDKDFAGVIVAKDWSGKEKARSIVKAGRITKRFKAPLSPSALLSSKIQSCQPGDIEVTEFARDDEMHIYGDGMITYQEGEWYPTGNIWCVSQEEVEDNSGCGDPGSMTCFCELIGGCDEEGGGDFPPDELKNNVVDPCLRSSVDNIISLDCENKITAFINSVFANSESNHLYFFDSQASSPDDANTGTGPMAGSITETKTIITLYNNQLSDASREYIAATIIHESLHAWINYKFPNPVDNNAQHNMMADPGRFNLMRDALLEMFPNMSLQDANDLTWGGLDNTLGFNNLPFADRQRIIETNSKYKHKSAPGGKGTAC